MISIEELRRRIDRMYSAVNATVEHNMVKINPAWKHYETPTGKGVMLDLSGGLSQADIENLAWSAIHNIAVFHAHCKIWAQGNNIPGDQVDAVSNSSDAILIVWDLHNFEKHPSQRPNASGKSPKLEQIDRVIRMVGGRIDFKFPDAHNVENVSPDSSVVVMGFIKNSKTGALVGRLPEVLHDALKAWETFLAGKGILS